MESAAILMRLGCLVFGTAAGLLLPGPRRDDHVRKGASEQANGLLHLTWQVGRTVLCCAAAALFVPLPVMTVFLYTGLGLFLVPLGAAFPEQKSLPVVYAWLILYLPVTGALASLGGTLMVLAAEVPYMAALAVLVLAAPMALLQYGLEGGIVLLGTAALLCVRQVYTRQAAGKEKFVPR